MNVPLVLIWLGIAQIQIPEVRVPEIRVAIPPPSGQIDISIDLSTTSPGQDLETLLVQERKFLEKLASNDADQAQRMAAETIGHKRPGYFAPWFSVRDSSRLCSPIGLGDDWRMVEVETASSLP